MPSPEIPIVRMTWDEWKAARAAKREALRRAGLDRPSIRTKSSSDVRLRMVFHGKRRP